MKGSLSSRIKNERKIECSFPVPAPKAANGCFTTTFSTGSYSLAQTTGKRSVPLGYVYIMHMQCCFRDPSARATRRAWYMRSCELRDVPGVSGTVLLRHSEAALVLCQSEPACNALGYVHVVLHFLAQTHPQ